MTAARHHPPSYHMQQHEPRERVIIEVLWNGIRQKAWDLSGPQERALAMAYEHLSALADYGALGEGLWKVRVGELSEEVRVGR